MFSFDIFIFFPTAKNKENTNPAAAQYKNAEFISEIIMTFFINIASVPENIKAKNR